MLKTFFTARSIAVVGASHDKHKLGNVVTHNLLSLKYRGTVYPVNPKGGTLYGRAVYPSVTEIPYDVDVALIVVPAPLVPSVMKECGQKKIKSVVIISAGFGEQDAAGARLEQQVLRIAHQYGISILGPNCLGLIVPGLKMNASFAAGMPDQGSVAVVSQSGAMAVAITEWALSAHLGFSALVSLGNKADVNEEDVLKHLGNDPQTNVIVLYLESLATGRSLLRTIKRISTKKPIIILKPGKSQEAQAAVASHTGAIAGAHAVQHAFLRAAGAVVVDTLEELFLYTKVFEDGRQLTKRSVAIVTNAGGPGILATDAVVAAPNLSLAHFSEKTKKYLESHLPEAAAIHNPVDVVGDADTRRYSAALNAALRDSAVDGVVALLTHQYVTDTAAIARVIIAAQKKFPRKPIAVAFIGGEGVEPGRELMTRAGILNFAYPEQAVTALSIIGRYYTNRDNARTFPETKLALTGRSTTVLGKKAEQLIRRYVPSIVPSALVRTADDAARKAKRLGYPVVAKIISAQLVHKTEAQAVKINIISEAELRSVISDWRQTQGLRFRKDEGYLLQQYRPGMVEVIIGAKRDPDLGPYLVVGLGGIFVEAVGGQEIIPVPMTKSQIAAVLTRGLLGRILMSPRGQRIPHQPLVDVIYGVSQLMADKPGIAELDLNPVMVSSDGVGVVDIRVVTRKQT